MSMYFERKDDKWTATRNRHLIAHISGGGTVVGVSVEDDLNYPLSVIEQLAMGARMISDGQTESFSLDYKRVQLARTLMKKLETSPIEEFIAFIEGVRASSKE